MSGLFSIESLSLILPAFLLFKLDKSIKLTHFAFPKYSPSQLEFQFVELVLKFTAVLTASTFIVSLKWWLFESYPHLSLLSILIVCFASALIVKLSIDLLYMGIQNGARGRTDPFVVITSFTLGIIVLVQSEHFTQLSPLQFISIFVIVFFVCSNTWLAELIEAKLDKRPSNVEIVKSATKNFNTPIVTELLSYRICRMVLHGLSPLVLVLVMFGEFRPSVYASLLLGFAIAIMFISPTLANSWAVIDSVRSSGMPLNQASVLLRFYSLVFSAIIFWLVGLAAVVSQIYVNSPSLSARDSQLDFDSVRDDVERLLVTGEYLNAAKLIRGSGIGTGVIFQYLPNAEFVSDMLGHIACMAIVIHASQTLCAIVVRRLKLELQKYM